MKWLPTVIIMVQIVHIFCSPPHLLFYIIFAPIKNHTNFYFFYFFCVRRIHLRNWSNIDREIPDELGQYQEKLKRIRLAARAPLTVRTYVCVFQSEIDSGHWSYDVFSKKLKIL